MITIRPFKPEDWDALCRIHDAARPDELKGSCDPRAFVPLSQEPEAEELRKSTILVAEEGDEVVGFSAVDGDYLGWLYVHPNHYHNGIGRKLLQNSLLLVPGQAWTIVLSENKPAIALYQSEGFCETSRFEGDNEGYPCTCLRMKRQPA
ncbi:MAG: GNAT family N-acetyltransferase [Caldilineaceae bacterium]|nr:GNAT family N-acetyltransferase [Caldilineaceae bacterium]